VKFIVASYFFVPYYRCYIRILFMLLLRSIVFFVKWAGVNGGNLTARFTILYIHVCIGSEDIRTGSAYSEWDLHQLDSYICCIWT